MTEAQGRYKRVMQPRWLSAKEIAYQLGLTVQGIQATLRRYEKQGLVVRKTEKRLMYWTWK